MTDLPESADRVLPRAEVYRILVYRTLNLGDVIQTVALSRLLPPARGVFRHQLWNVPREGLVVYNGFLDKDRPPWREAASAHAPRFLFAGVSGPHFRQRAYLRWLSRSPFPIGARDRPTFDRLQAHGINSELTECVTLTLPRYSGARSGVYSVDYPGGPGRHLTQRIPRSLTVEEQWSAAVAALERLRTAESVYTSRLHVALPCLAFGTPVCIADPVRTFAPGRFSPVEELGIPYGKLVTADVTTRAKRYLTFLEQHVEQPIRPGEPRMPDVPLESGGAPSRLRWMLRRFL